MMVKQHMYALFCIGILFSKVCPGQYKTIEHRKLEKGEVAVSSPGNYGKAGTTYVLTNNIYSKTSPVFLGNNIVFDLNGYTVKFVDAAYEHIPNSGFEQGLTGWNISKAKGAKVVNTADIHVFLGKKLMSLERGDEIVSSYVNLPVANRSYFAMCGITGRYYNGMYKYPDDEMKVSIYVEDEKGKEVTCITKYGDTTMVSCPIENRSPRLGGGFVYAHLDGLPAGKYRIRVKAETDCLVDEIDVRPAMDVGISVIEKTSPFAHYDHLYKESWPPIMPAFFDFTGDVLKGTPLSQLPIVKGKGTIIIKNGIIENGFEGIQSWGIQSTAEDVKVVLENVQIKNSGISSGAADIRWANIKDCQFDVDMPFLIQRHVNLCAVVLRGDRPSEVKNTFFNGGQGNLSIKGKHSLVHNNTFINRQTVTNHYSIMGTGDSSKIYDNNFFPSQGSGIYVSRYTEVFNNHFKIATSPPTCEYGREEYSVAAIRLGDYGAAPGSPKASVGNRIHHNHIEITANPYPEPKEYLPMAWGIFYSASGGENYVYDNEILVNKTDTTSKLKTAALYICGGPKYFGGQFYNNRITTNVPAAWIATMYGGASNSNLYNNIIVSLHGAKYKTFSIGYDGCDNCIANTVAFKSNKISGNQFDLDVTDQNHSYAVYWTLTINIFNAKNRLGNKGSILIYDRQNKLIHQRKINSIGLLRLELPQYVVKGSTKIISSPYTIRFAGQEKVIELIENKTITFQLK